MFATNDRVTRKFDGKAGTVVDVNTAYPGVAVAVLMDFDSQVWSGTAEAWELVRVNA